MSASDIASVPVIDIGGFGSGDADADAAIATEVAAAARDLGFLIVSGHGVPQATIDAMYESVLEFFALPLDAKREVRSPTSNLYQGYAHPGTEPGDHTSERQSFNVQRFDTVADAIAAGYPSDGLDGFLYDALWPASPVGFRDAVRAYFDEMQGLSTRLLSMLELGLGLSPGRFTSLFEHHLSNQAVNYYSDDIDSGHEPTPYRFKAHLDGSMITVLYQDDGPGGLQLYRRSTGWIDVPAIDGTFVVNTGETLTHLTNGLYPATPHRVLHPPKDAPKRPRVSAPYFVKPSIDVSLAPLPELVPDGEEPKYPELTARTWSERNLQNIREGYDSTRQFEEFASENPEYR